MVYILLCDGFEDMEAVIPYDLLTRAGIQVNYLGVCEAVVTGAHGTKLLTHELASEADFANCEMLILPGGRRGVENLLTADEAHRAIQTVWNHGGYVAAVCAAPVVLAKLGLTKGRRATCYPDSHWTEQMDGAVLEEGSVVVADGKLITGLSAGQCVPFGLKLVEVLRGRETAQQVKEAIVWM